jgi:hypothetical protein
VTDFDRAVAHARSTVASSRISTGLQRVVAARHNATERIEEQVVKNGSVHGFIDIEDYGETLVEVSFPVVFLEKPVFTYGHELADNVWPTDGSFPVASATVISWITRDYSGDRRFYTGANIGITIFGHKGMRSVLHYVFAGQIFTNPSVTDPTIGGTL